MTVILTLGGAAKSNDAVTVAYQPYNGRNIKGTNGVNISAFYDEPVANLTQAYTIEKANEDTGLLGQTCEITVTPTENDNLQGKYLVIQVWDAGKTSVMAVKLTDSSAQAETVTISYANKAGIVIDAWLMNNTAADLTGELISGDYLANAQFTTNAV